MNARYSGYTVRYQDATVNLRITVAEGVRGIDIPCSVSFTYPENVPQVYCQANKLTVTKVEYLPLYN